MSNLQELQNKIFQEITEERTAQIKAIKEADAEAKKAGEKKMQLFTEHFKGIGVDAKQYDAYDKALTSISEADVKSLRQKYARQANEASLSAGFSQVNDSPSFSPDIATGQGQLVIPSFTARFTTEDQRESPEMVGQDIVFNNNTLKYWNWARGAGSGLFGTGAASNTQWIEFGFWFRPGVSKVWSIIPRNVFRGYYIVQADDAWYDSKEAKATVNVWINVNQYNWKGWSTHNILSIGGDNINRNNRLDTDRNNYHSALLAANDWAYIRVSVELSVYARGGGSYSELNFNAGNANFLQCPYCIIS